MLPLTLIVELPSGSTVLSRTTPDASRLDAAELLVRRMHLRYLTGRGFIGVDDMREAVRLSAIAPGSWQHALALAELLTPVSGRRTKRAKPYRSRPRRSPASPPVSAPVLRAHGARDGVHKCGPYD